jgi:hypothetical protein
MAQRAFPKHHIINYISHNISYTTNWFEGQERPVCLTATRLYPGIVSKLVSPGGTITQSGLERRKIAIDGLNTLGSSSEPA